MRKKERNKYADVMMKTNQNNSGPLSATVRDKEERVRVDGGKNNTENFDSDSFLVPPQRC